MELYSQLMQHLKKDFFDAIIHVLQLRMLKRISSIKLPTELESSIPHRYTEDESLNNVISTLSGEEEVTDEDMLCICEILSTFSVICPSILAEHIMQHAQNNPLDCAAISALSVLSVVHPSGNGNDGGSPSSSTTNQASKHVGVSDAELSILKTFKHKNISCILFLLIDALLYESDNAILEQTGDVIKVLLDTQRVAGVTEKDRFLSMFYEHHIHWLFSPFNYSSLAVYPDRTLFNQDTSSMLASRRHVCEIISQCVLMHTFRMKYYILRNHTISKILLLLSSKSKSLHILSLKMFRNILAVKDEFYYRHIAKCDHFKLIIACLMKNSKKDNLITCVILEMLEYIRSERIRTLIEYIVRSYDAGLSTIMHCDVYDQLKLRYDQYLDNSGGDGGMGEINSNDPSCKRRQLIYEAESADAYFDGDDDDANEGGTTYNKIFENFDNRDSDNVKYMQNMSSEGANSMLSNYPSCYSSLNMQLLT